MRHLTRVSLVVLAVLLAVGPLAAAPLQLHATPQLVAPLDRADGPLGVLAKIVAVGVAAFGAIRIKDTGSLAQKFSQRAGAASGDYKDGVATGGQDWENNARAGNDAWKQGVQDAVAKDRFAKGVTGSQQKYINNATNLGPQRYQQGVANAKDAWSRGVAPFLDTLRNLSLPPRGPKGSPANMQRASVVASELAKARDAQ